MHRFLCYRWADKPIGGGLSLGGGDCSKYQSESRRPHFSTMTWNHLSALTHDLAIRSNVEPLWVALSWIMHTPTHNNAIEQRPAHLRQEGVVMLWVRGVPVGPIRWISAVFLLHRCGIISRVLVGSYEYRSVCVTSKTSSTTIHFRLLQYRTCCRW